MENCAQRSVGILPSAAADAARHTRASQSYHTACHVHFLWLATKLTGQERQFRQLHPLRFIHAPRVRRQNAYATLAPKAFGASARDVAVFCANRRLEIA